MLKGGEEYKYALKRQAIPVVFNNMSHMLQAVRDRKVVSALLDVYVAAKNRNELTTLKLEEVIEHMYEYESFTLCPNDPVTNKFYLSPKGIFQMGV